MSEFLPWDEFMEVFDWQQGEHLTAIGPTGSGKTTLVNHLLPLRDYVIFAGTKKVDTTVDWLETNLNFKVVEDYRTIHPDVTPRVIARPGFPRVDANELRARHHTYFADLMMYVFQVGGWTLDLDEVRYLTDFLQLKAEYELLLLQGRSLGISVVSKTQRPRMIPLTAYDQASHLFFWRDTDQQNLDRVASLGAALDRDTVIREIATMPKHDVLYVGTHTGVSYRTRVDV